MISYGIQGNALLARKKKKFIQIKLRIKLTNFISNNVNKLKPLRYYCAFQNKRQVAIFRITFDRNEIESCGFDHSKEKSWGHKYVSNSIG